jgi:hypothetical protein
MIEASRLFLGGAGASIITARRGDVRLGNLNAILLDGFRLLHIGGP